MAGSSKSDRIYSRKETEISRILRKVRHLKDQLDNTSDTNLVVVISDNLLNAKKIQNRFESLICREHKFILFTDQNDALRFLNLNMYKVYVVLYDVKLKQRLQNFLEDSTIPAFNVSDSSLNLEAELVG